jgi:cytochrome c-type protein NapB
MTVQRVLLVLLVATVFTVAFRRAGWDAPAGPGVSDLALGLRKTALTDDRVPPLAVFTDATPGGNSRLARAYDGAPPLIPHSLEGFVPIRSSENACLLCHQTGSTDPADPPQVPRSHLVDLRAAPAVVRETVVGARWNCTACHVMQSDAPALVGNRFGSPGR